MSNKSYAAKLKDPRWQKKRLEILGRDEWMCQRCQDTESTLHVHHRYYQTGNEPWDYPDTALVALCEDCHEEERREYKEFAVLLIQTLKSKGFWGYSLFDLAHGFHCLESSYPPQVVADSIKFALGKKEAVDGLVKEYFAHLAESRGKRKAARSSDEQNC